MSLSLTTSTLPAWALHWARYCNRYFDASVHWREKGALNIIETSEWREGGIKYNRDK